MLRNNFKRFIRDIINQGNLAASVARLLSSFSCWPQKTSKSQTFFNRNIFILWQKLIKTFNNFKKSRIQRSLRDY